MILLSVGEKNPRNFTDTLSAITTKVTRNISRKPSPIDQDEIT